MKNLNPSISILIPTRNRAASLKETLTSILKSNYTIKNIEIIIINNASDDNTFTILKRFKIKESKLKIIRNKTNNGFAPALNQGIKIINSPYVLITNDDVLFDKDCIRQLIETAVSSKLPGIVTGKMFFRDRPRQLALPYFKFNMWLGYLPYDNKGLNHGREIDIATGGLMLVKREVFKRVGLFDERFFFCGEDYDFCYRAKKKGVKILYNPKAKVWHGFLGSGKKDFAALENHFYGKFSFMFKHANLLQLAMFLPIQLFFAPFYIAFVHRQNNFGPIISAFQKALKVKS